MMRRSRKKRNIPQDTTGDEESSFVICRLCRKPFRSIAQAHLFHVHGMDGDHPVRDYKERFNVPSAACPDLRERLTAARVEEWTNRGRHLTPHRMLTEIRKRAKSGQSLRYSSVPMPLWSAASRHFGSWRAAIEAAGFDYEQTTGYRSWTREKVIAEIRRLAKINVPLNALEIDRRDGGLYRAARQLFPQGWSGALAAAGFDPAEHRKGVSRWDAVKAAAWVSQRLGDHLRARPIDAPADLRRFVRRRLKKSWNEFLKPFGISYPRGIPQWSPARVVDEIHRRNAGGKKLHFTAVSRTQPNLSEHARQEFGSWDAALRAAGFDPAEHRLWSARRWDAAQAQAWLHTRIRDESSILWCDVPTDLREFVQKRLGIGWIAFVESCGIVYPRTKPRHDWSKKTVIQEIRLRKSAGRKLNASSVQADCAGLLRQAVKYFGSWDAACVAAGIGVQRVNFPRQAQRKR